MRDFFFLLLLIVIIVALGITSCFVGLLCSINLSGNDSQGWWLTHEVFFWFCFLRFYRDKAQLRLISVVKRKKLVFWGGFCVHNTDKLTAKPQTWIRKHVFPTPLWFISVQLVNSPRKVFVFHLLHLNEVRWSGDSNQAGHFLVQNYDTWWWNNLSYSPFKQSSCQDKE